MPEAPEVRRDDDAGARRYAVRTPEGEAEMTLTVLSPSLVSADHTFVPEALRGQGLAEALLAALLADARTEGFRIVPRCAFVAAQARRHPEWAALFAA